jgi:amino acid transporter
VSFLFAWCRFSVITTGSIALLAFVFGDYMTQVVSLGPYSSAIWGVASVLLLTWLNVRGVKQGAATQVLLTGFEVAGLLLVFVAGVYAAWAVLGESAPEAVAAAKAAAPAVGGSAFSLGAFGFAMVFVLLTFGGWNEAAYISAELKGGPRTMVRVILASMLILTAIYLLVNTALLLGLGLSGLSQSKTAAGDLLGLAFGPWAQKALGLFVAIAALTSINATMFVGARTNFAVGSDWKALRKLGQWQLDIGSPKQALTLQALISMGLIALGTQEADGFSAMVEFTAPVFWGFLFLVGLALLWLRQTDPSTTRPFKVPLYPVLPLIFCAACAWLTYSSVTYAISQKAIHVSMWLIASGILALLILRSREKALDQLPHQI